MEYWKINKAQIIDSIINKRYEPGVSRQYEQLNKKGKKRTITLMCSIDKMLSRAILQILGPKLDVLLSERCYGYRRGLGTKDVADFAARAIEKGYHWVVELDISNFFDTIPHKELLVLISKLINNDVVVDFISSFVTCVIADDEREVRLAKGIIQGMPLSPLLSNIFMTDLDSYCENRYEGYCRYGDDIRILTRTQSEGTQVFNDIKRIIELKGLLINKKKSGVFEALNRPWLGYSLSSKDGHVLISRYVRQKNQCTICGIHPW